MNQAELQLLAIARIDEAKVLLDAGSYAGSYYLAGYSVECALKACIAKLTRQGDYPDKDFAGKRYTHNLETLVGLAGLKAVRDADPGLVVSWAVVKDWNESTRYVLKSHADAAALYTAITDRNSGVLPWIKRHW